MYVCDKILLNCIQRSQLPNSPTLKQQEQLFDQLAQNFWALSRRQVDFVVCQLGWPMWVTVGQTRLLVQPKIGQGRNSPSLESPKNAAAVYSLTVLLSFYLRLHCCKIQLRCSKKLSSLYLGFGKLFNWRLGQSPGEGVNLAGWSVNQVKFGNRQV